MSVASSSVSAPEPDRSRMMYSRLRSPPFRRCVLKARRFSRHSELLETHSSGRDSSLSHRSAFAAAELELTAIRIDRRVFSGA